MFTSTLLAIFLVPLFFVVVRRWFPDKSVNQSERGEPVVDAGPEGRESSPS